MNDYKTLIEKYPLLFEFPEDSPEPFALFGFECCIGWFNIIDAACKTIYSDYKYFKGQMEYYKDQLDNLEKSVQERMSWDKDKTEEWITNYITNNFTQATEAFAKAKVELPRFVQIKQKFGTLRMYYDGGNETVKSVVSMAEDLSSTTCESCGNVGKLYRIGWHRTLCPHHAEVNYGDKLKNHEKDHQTSS